MKSREDYIKEIAEKINNGKEYYIKNPTVDDVKKLCKDFDTIVTDGSFFRIRIGKKYIIDTVLNIPTVFWNDGYSIADSCMGEMPMTFSAEDVIEEMKALKEITD